MMRPAFAIILAALLCVSAESQAADIFAHNSAPGWECEIQMAPNAPVNEDRIEIEQVLVELEQESQRLQSPAAREMGQLVVDRIRFSLTGQHPALTPYPGFVRELRQMDQVLSDATFRASSMPRRRFAVMQPDEILNYANQVLQRIREAIHSSTPPVYGFAHRVTHDFNSALLLVRAYSEGGAWLNRVGEILRNVSERPLPLSMMTSHLPISAIANADVYTLRASFDLLSIADINDMYALLGAPIGMTQNTSRFDGNPRERTELEMSEHDELHAAALLNIWRDYIVAWEVLDSPTTNLIPEISLLRVVREGIARLRFHHSFRSSLPTDQNLRGAMELLLFQYHEGVDGVRAPYTAPGVRERVSSLDDAEIERFVTRIRAHHDVGDEYPALHAMDEDALTMLLNRARSKLLTLVDQIDENQ